jgi:hypothetical protein
MILVLRKNHRTIVYNEYKEQHRHAFTKQAVLLRLLLEIQNLVLYKI